MQEFITNLLDNAESFLNRIPETKGSKLFIRADGNVPMIHDLNTPAGMKKAVIEIGVDNPEIQESRVLFRKEHLYNPLEMEPQTILSILIQMILSDMVSFSIGQTIMMFRKADREGVILVDKQPSPAPAPVPEIRSEEAVHRTEREEALIEIFQDSPSQDDDRDDDSSDDSYGSDD